MGSRSLFLITFLVIVTLSKTIGYYTIFRFSPTYVYRPLRDYSMILRHATPCDDIRKAQWQENQECMMSSKGGLNVPESARDSMKEVTTRHIVIDPSF